MSAPLSALFQQIETLIPTLDGWCTVERASEFAALVIGNKPQTTVCLGVWGGRDTFALALAHRHNGVGRVIAIDPWKAEASVQGQTGEDAAWWGKQETHDLVHSRFITNIGVLGLQDFIDVRRQTSDEARVAGDIGLLIVDGNHGQQAVRDVEKFATHVPAGGYVYMDDIDWSGGAVREAVGTLLRYGFRELYRRNTGAFFQATR